MESSLRIDEGRAMSAIIATIQNLVEGHSSEGVLLGLSGGIDSSLLAACAVRALGADRVHARYLYDRTSSRVLHSNARLAADWLGIGFQVRDIDPEMETRGVYSQVAVRVLNVAGWLNRILVWLYCSLVGETPFVSSLRRGGISGEDMSSAYGQYVRDPEWAINTRHIWRRRVLEEEARLNNWLLLGAANRTEWLTGWFVKGGVDDLPFQPLKGLYKTQVRQLAAFLGVPEAIRSQSPSPDMVKGITDEHGLGMCYEKIDLALDYLEGGLTEEELLQAGVTKAEVRVVEQLKQLSGWKREAGLKPPPVDGGPHGNVRV
ncbi:MAG: NAD(+) synthase [Chloroflexota bacterium]